MKPESHKFLENAQSCLKDAKWAMKGDRHEMVVNRAYYAIFNSIRALLFEQSVFAKTHQGVHRKFHELFIKTNSFSVEYGASLALIAEWRQEGDYDIDAEITDDIAATALERAEQFLEKVEAFLA